MKNLIKKSAVIVCFVASTTLANQTQTTMSGAPTTPNSTGTPPAGTTGKAVDGATMTDVVTTSDAARSELLAITEVKDVGTLNGNLKKYNGKIVRLKAEVGDKIDARTAVIEGGGIFNNEIIMTATPTAKGTQVSSLRKDDKVLVTGKLYMKSLDDFKRENAWTLAPQAEEQLGKKRAVLIVDEIIPVSN